MTSRGFLRAGVIVGTLLACAPLWGVIGAMLGMFRAFRILGKNGISDPHALSNTVGSILLLTAGGLVLCPCGIVLLVVCARLLQPARTPRPPPMPRFPET